MIGKEQAPLLGKHEHSIPSTTLSRDTRQSCRLSIYLSIKCTAAAPKDGYNLPFRHNGISAKRVFLWADLERRPPKMFQFGSSSRILDPSCRMALRISSNLYYRILIHWGAKKQREKGTTPKRRLVEQEEMDLLHHDGCGGADALGPYSKVSHCRNQWTKNVIRSNHKSPPILVSVIPVQSATLFCGRFYANPPR